MILPTKFNILLLMLVWEFGHDQDNIPVLYAFIFTYY